MFDSIIKEANAASRKAVDLYVQQNGEPLFCGFAWVQGIKGNSSFGRWLKKNGIGRKGYPTGRYISTHDMDMGDMQYTQSMYIKEVAADAYCRVLCNHGIACYVMTRAD